MNDAEQSVVQHGGQSPAPLSKLVDWLVAAFLILGGLLATAVGALLYGAADIALISDLVAQGRLQSAELTDAQLIDVTYGLLWWGGLGLIVTGLLLVVAGIAFVAVRTRARRRRVESGAVAPDTTAIAIAGGVVSIVTSFVPLSPILGGLAAGYLRGGTRSDGARIGAYAGIVAALPVSVVMLFALGGFAIVAGQVGLTASISVFVGVSILFAALVGVAYMVGLSALGGYFGVSYSKNTTPTDPDETLPA
jgi:hypothetical protein